MTEPETESQSTQPDTNGPKAAPVISMKDYKKEQEEAWAKDRKQQHIDVATKAIRADKPTVTVVLGDGGLEIYSNLTGSPLHSLLAMSAHTMLGAIPRDDYEVRT